MQRLTPAAPQPAGHVLKPLEHIAVAAKGTVLNRASYGLLRRTNHPPAPAPLPAHSNVRIMRHRSCPAARTKARDDEAEPEPEAPAPKQGEEAAAAGRNRGQRSMAYQIFEAVYLCAYVLSWRIGELIVVNAEDALKRLRGYVLEKFNQKR